MMTIDEIAGMTKSKYAGDRPAKPRLETHLEAPFALFVLPDLDFNFPFLCIHDRFPFILRSRRSQLQKLVHDDRHLRQERMVPHERRLGRCRGRLFDRNMLNQRNIVLFFLADREPGAQFEQFQPVGQSKQPVQPAERRDEHPKVLRPRRRD